MQILGGRLATVTFKSYPITSCGGRLRSRSKLLSGWTRVRTCPATVMGLGPLSKPQRGTAPAASKADLQPSADGSDASLIDYITSSPLLGVCGLTAADIRARLGEWRALGLQVSANLNLPAYDQMEEHQRRRIYQYYLPVFFWCQAQLEAHRSSGAASGPLVIGISAPQGCGKSTLCEQLQALFEHVGASAASISIDDFYLTHEAQAAVAAAHAGNPLLQMRGNAGSHDVDLGAATLRALRSATTPAAAVPLPRYDKSAYEGRGDRADPSTWPKAQGPVDVVLFEGWMLGFNSVGAEAAAKVDPHLVDVDAALQEYKAAWDSHVNCWLVVKVEDPGYAHQWRLQAERAMRASGRRAMSDSQVAAFVDCFMPAYRCYLPGLYAAGPTTAAPGKLLVVEVDGSREPVARQPPPVM